MLARPAALAATATLCLLLATPESLGIIFAGVGTVVAVVAELRQLGAF